MKLIILTFGIAAAVPATIKTDDTHAITSGETATSKAKSVEKVLKPKNASALLARADVGPQEYGGKINELWAGAFCHSSSKAFAECCEDRTSGVANHKACAAVCQQKGKSYFLFGTGDQVGECICTKDRCTEDTANKDWNFYLIGASDFVKCIDQDSGDNQYGTGNEREVCPMGCYRKCGKEGEPGCNHPGTDDTMFYDCAEGIDRKYDLPDGGKWESTSDCCEHEDKLYGSCGGEATSCPGQPATTSVLLHHSKTCRVQAKNLGKACVATHASGCFSKVLDCVQAAQLDPSCGGAIMWSPAYGYSWGCRCCKAGHEEGGGTNTYWDLYAVPK
jgi:hypothetical protein